MLFALVGNPNCGKTTLFNRLTGSNQHVGNFPGVTVEQKYGTVNGYDGLSVADLPGIYSLRTCSEEERIAGAFLSEAEPDIIINIVDATNLQRNLYLTLQLMELGKPLLLALNMTDELRRSGGAVDTGVLSDMLGIPVVPISAAKNEGITEMTERDLALATEKRRPDPGTFSAEIEAMLYSVACGVCGV